MTNRATLEALIARAGLMCRRTTGKDGGRRRMSVICYNSKNAKEIMV